MNIIDNETYTNAYMKAADMRCLLHEIVVNNKYGFTAILIKYIRNSTRFKLSNDENYPAELTVGGSYNSAIFCDYNLEENGFGNSSKLSTIDTAMYVDLLSTFAGIIVDIIKYLRDYNAKHNIVCEDLESIYEFVTTNMAATKSSVAMLFDIRIYMDHFILII